MSASVTRIPESPNAPEDKTALAKPAAINGELLRGVRVALEVRLGEAPMTVEEIMALKAGSIVTLKAGLADHVELFLNDTLVARGEIVAVGEKYGVRIVDIAPAG